jgi:hypothetical protein
MKKTLNILIVFGFLALMMSSCTEIPGFGQRLINDTPSDTLATKPPTPEPLTVKQAADRVIQALAARDLEALASSVHPHQGLRFSPYAFVREEHQAFAAEDLQGLFDTDEVRLWGRYDGTGEPIKLSFEEYYEEFIYSADFANAGQVAVDERLGQGNTINNIHDFYPEASYVEYYIPGTEEYGGMDWESLRLVFVQENDVWILVGIVHDEWTI